MMKRFDMGVSLTVCFGLLLTAIVHAETGAVVFLMGSGNQDSCGKLIAAIGDVSTGQIPRHEHGDWR
jgi:hypothetical protein